MKTYRLLLSGLLLLLLFVAPVDLRAQDTDEDEELPTNRGWLTMAVDKRGAARISLRLPVRVGDNELVKRSLVDSFSFPVQLTEAEDDEEESGEQTADESSTSPWTMINGESARTFDVHGLTSSCRINLHSLLSVLQSNNIEHLEIRAFFENESADTPVKGAQRLSRRDIHLDMYEAEIDVRAPSRQVIEFTIGYSTVDVLKRTIPLVAVLFLPLLWTRRSARKFSDRPEELWGRHLRFIGRLLKVIWIVWLPIYALSGLDTVISFALGDDQRDIAELVNLSLYFLPPILAMLLCHFASRKVYELVPAIEFSPSDVVRSAIAVTTFWLAPLFLIILGINTFRTNPRQAALYAVIGYVCWLLLGRVADQGWKPADALTPGALRDRIFELANKAGIVLKEVYLLPENRAQLANAYAASNDTVAVTNSVVKHLSRREVDAVMAHEIGHLKARHPHMAKTRTLLIIIVANVVGSVVAWMTNLRHSPALVFSGALAVSALAVFFISRRNERQADDIGITLTEDPEAFISGMAKLTRLGLAPMHQSAWGESLDTHPGTMRRNQEIAQAHGISDERVQELVADSTASPDDKYPANETNEDQSWVFSWVFKKQYRLRTGLVSLGVMLLPPIPFAMLFLANDGLIRLPIFIVAAITCFAFVQLVRNKIRFWGQASHARKLRVQLDKRGLAEIARSGTIVGLAPAAESRIYDGYPFWDVGVLWLTDEKLYYIGELTQFALERDRVQNVYTQDAQPEWLPEKNLFLEWQKDGQEEKETLHFVAIGARSTRHARRAIDSLRERLECWRNRSLDLPSVDGLESVVGPAFPEITSVPTRTTFHAPSVVAAAVQLACYAGLVGFALRLSVLGMCFVAGVLFVGTFLDEIPKSFRKYRVKESFDPSSYQRGSWADSNVAEPRLP